MTANLMTDLQHIKLYHMLSKLQTRRHHECFRGPNGHLKNPYAPQDLSLILSTGKHKDFIRPCISNILPLILDRSAPQNRRYKPSGLTVLRIHTQKISYCTPLVHQYTRGL